MKTLIIPCAGKSTRFPGMKPKWMLTHPEGMIMLQKNLSGFDLNQFDRIIITIVKVFDESYEALLVLKQAFPDKKFEFLALEDFTNGPAATVYETIKKCKVEGPVVVRDSDSYVSANLTHLGENFVIGLSLSNHIDIGRVANKSFIVLNEQNNVVDIVEKKIVSDLISVGVYGFSSADDFVDVYESLISKLDTQYEVYVSHVTAYLIGVRRQLVNYTVATNYEDWGTLENWKTVQKNHATYFFDIDGVLLKNCGKYGSYNWDCDFQPIKENLEILRKLQIKGSMIILTTCRPEKYRARVEEFFLKENIKIHALVMGINHSPRILVNDFAPTNPYPVCEAVNIPRNSSLENYID